MTKQTWLNLRAEYIDELAYQFQLMEKPSDKRNDVFIEKSAKRCRAYDYLIQSHANIFDNKNTDSIQ